MVNKEKQWVEIVAKEYSDLKSQFQIFKDILKEFKGLEQLSCSIETSEDPTELKIVIPFDATILVRFSIITFTDRPSRGRLTFEKLAIDKEQRNKPFWKQYLDGDRRLYENPQDETPFLHINSQTETFYITLLKKFIDEYLSFENREKLY